MPRTVRTDTLSQTQRLILDHAARNPERRLTRPEGIKAPIYRSALQALRRRGLIADRPVTGGARPPAGPTLTRAGLAMLGLDTPATEAVPPAGAETARSPRSGTKQALVVTMLARPGGATIDDLTAITAWLPHTTRAALTGLPKRGFAVLTVRAAGETTRYRLASVDAQGANPGPTAAETATAEVAQ